MVVNIAMDIAISKLTQLGFTENEAKAYTALLSENPLTAYEIAKISGMPTSKIYEVVRKLEKRNIIQSIHGERSKMFIPVSPDEFIQNYRTVMEDNLLTIKNELKDIKTGMDTSYTWHIKNYDDLISKAKRMLNTARTSILLSIWPSEADPLLSAIQNAETRDIKIAVIHYGPTKAKINQLYIHPAENTIFSERGGRGFTVIADSKEALNGIIADKKTEAIWSMNEGFVIMAESYIRHDIYQMKTMKRLDPLLRNIFGNGYEKMRDIFSDKE